MKINSGTFSKLLLASTMALSLFSCAKGVQDLTALRENNSSADLEKIYQEVSVPDHPLTLDHIIQVALDQNLEVRLREQELAIQRETTTAEKLRQLPSLTASGEYSYRDENTASTSESVIDGTPASIGSISTDQHTKKFDITLAWSILDFGLSYYKAKREANKTILLRLQHQRMQQNMIFDIVRAYWRTIVAKRAALGAEILIEMAEKTQVDLRRQIDRKIISEIEGLTNENRLIDMQIKLQIFQNEYNSAIAELAQFMGLAPGTQFELAAADLLPVGDLNVNLKQLEDEAIHNRPELFAQDVEEQIQVDDVKATILQMFPNLNLFAGENYNGDSHLLNSNWLSVGAQASWNLLSIPSLAHEVQATKGRQQLVQRTRLTESVAILTQVHLAYINHMDTIKQYELAKELYAVKTRLLEAAKKEQEQGVFHGADILEFQVEALFARINTLKAYAEVQVGLERVGNSVGLPMKYGGELRRVAYASQETDINGVAVNAEQEKLLKLLNSSLNAYTFAAHDSELSDPAMTLKSDPYQVTLFYRKESIIIPNDQTI